MRKAAPPRRPKWITWNKVLVALHFMSDDEGVVKACPREIARNARLGWRAVESALQVLETRGHLQIVEFYTMPWTIVLTDRSEPEDKTSECGGPAQLPCVQAEHCPDGNLGLPTSIDPSEDRLLREPRPIEAAQDPCPPPVEDGSCPKLVQLSFNW